MVPEKRLRTDAGDSPQRAYEAQADDVEPAGVELDEALQERLQTDPYDALTSFLQHAIDSASCTRAALHACAHD